jgi:hypothetical protein
MAKATGRIVVENAQAREVNTQGGLLDMPKFPSVGSQLELISLISGETYRARVVAIRCKEGRVIGVAVELLVPSKTFWGVNFQLKKTSAELLQLEHTIRSGGIDGGSSWISATLSITYANPRGPCRNGRNAG